MEHGTPSFHELLTHGPEFAKMTGVFIALLFGFALVGLLVAVVICWLLSDVQKRIPPPFRRIEPGMVWLLLIPCFKLVWNFIALPKISQSYKAYFNAIGRADVGDCGERLAIACSACAACAMLVGFVFSCLGLPVLMAAWVLLIVYLVKILGLKNQIAVSGAEYSQEESYRREE